MNLIQYEEFEKIDIRVGTILQANVFPEARKPAYQLLIDFGSELGVKKSSAQITKQYQVTDLVGKQVLAVINFPEKQIGPFKSQVLVLGLSDEKGDVVLIKPDFVVPNGRKLF